MRFNCEREERSSAWWRRARRIARVVAFMGFDPLRLARNLAEFPHFIGDVRSYSRKLTQNRFPIRLLDLYPVLHERGESAGSARGHYFHQDLWAAQKIFERRPKQHVDIGSRVDGFVAHLLTFMPVTVIDLRTMESEIRGLHFIRDDATRLATFPDCSVDSLSSLHAAEHFGLGRYSDPIDPDACFRFMTSLQRVLRSGGRLYFSVPIGRERVDFNAHRVFAPVTVLRAFPQLSLVSFSYVDDAGRLHEDAVPVTIPALEYGCGLFEFSKSLSEGQDAFTLMQPQGRSA